MNTETEILFGIVIFLAVLGFISLSLPSQFQILNSFDFGFLSASILGVAGVCATSILGTTACGVALGVFAIVQFILYFIVPTTFSFIKPLIIVPVVFIIVYIVSRLARGGG